MDHPESPAQDALAFLQAHPCRLVDGDKIQLPPGLSVDLVAMARDLKPALL